MNEKVTRVRKPASAFKRSDAAFISLIVVAGFAFVIPAVTSGGIVGRFPSDGTRAFYFIREYLLSSLSEGRLPLWNPYTYWGQPFLANMQWGVLYPLNVLLIFFPQDVAYNLFLGIHLSLAGVFMYLLARDWGLAWASAGVAAFAYMLSGRFVAYAWGGVLNILSTAIWLPLVLMLFDRALRAPRHRAGYTAVATLAFAMEILSGHPEYSFFTGFILLASAVWSAVQEFRRGAPPGKRLVPLALWGAVIGGGAALSAMQLIPTYEATQLSTRGFSWTWTWPRGVIEGSYNPLRLIAWVVPDLFGNPVSLRPAATDWLSLVLREVHSNEFQGYVGVLPLALAIFSLANWRTEGRARFLWLLLLVSLVLSLGGFTPVYRLVYAAVPPLRTFRIPARFLSVVVFAAALLAGFGAQALLHAACDRVRGWAKVLSVLAVAFLFGALGAYVLRYQAFDVGRKVARPLFSQRPASRFMDEQQREALIGKAYMLALHGALVTGGLAAASAGVFALAGSGGQVRSIIPVALLGFTVLDLGAHALPYMSSERLETHLRENAVLVKILREAGGMDRELTLQATSRDSRPDPVRPSDNAFMHFRLFAAGGYDPFELATYRAVISLVQEELRAGSAYPAGLLGLRYIVSEAPLADPDLHSVGTLGPATVYENSRSLPRFYVATEALSVTGTADAIGALHGRAVVPGRQVLIEGSLAPSRGQGAHGQGRVQVLAFAAEHVVLSVSSEEPGFLVANDTFYPGWLASVDGQPASVLRANGLVRAVPIPAGTHRVEMRFSPWSLVIGIWISAATAILGLGTLAWAWFRNHHERKPCVSP